MSQGTPGASAIFAKLADVFLTQALRSYLAAANAGSALLQAVRPDPDIARVLKLARAQLEARWTVGSPAHAAGMSYLTRQRLSRAAGYLSTTGKSVRQIAHLVGYDNEASFTEAFRRAFGRPPGQYRREQVTIGLYGVLGQRFGACSAGECGACHIASIGGAQP